MKVDLDAYSEAKKGRLRRIVWFFVNIVIYPILSNRNRSRLLRLFGARVGKRCRLYRSVRYYAPWNLALGDFVCIGSRTVVYNKDSVSIGSQVVISQDSYLCTASHDVTSPSMALVTHPIKICNQVWIAAKATVLPGATIGEGAVVGACAVVAKDVPSWTIVVGNPAREVGKRVLRDPSECKS